SETKNIISEQLNDLKEAGIIIRESINHSDKYFDNGLLIYCTHDNPYEFANFLKDKINKNNIDIMYDKRKLYCIPKSMNKGNGIKRFKNKFLNSGCKCVVAGDSEFDVPMLNCADVAIFPEILTDKITAKRMIQVTNDYLLSDKICGFFKKKG
ncbi:MAG: HAD hydrolase family protein, partial [Deferribacterales bacterium]|nr:HAD hydrolase family protein [Deferribacterales bacterium]